MHPTSAAVLSPVVSLSLITPFGNISEFSAISIAFAWRGVLFVCLVCSPMLVFLYGALVKLGRAKLSSFLALGAIFGSVPSVLLSFSGGPWSPPAILFTWVLLCFLFFWFLLPNQADYQAYVKPN